MHVNPKKIAVAGMLAACSAVLLVLGSVIESSSLFFIGLASFCVGIAIREWGLGFGGAFWIASTLVNLIVSPNKFYCITYAGMGLYLILSQALFQFLEKKHLGGWLWPGKYLIFNVMFLPACIFLRDVFFTREIKGLLWIVVILGGQALLFFYDTAHGYFQSTVWGRIRGRLLE